MRQGGARLCTCYSETSTPTAETDRIRVVPALSVRATLGAGPSCTNEDQRLQTLSPGGNVMQSRLGAGRGRGEVSEHRGLRRQTGTCWVSDQRTTPSLLHPPTPQTSPALRPLIPVHHVCPLSDIHPTRPILLPRPPCPGDPKTSSA